jgi:hypothetical protein
MTRRDLFKASTLMPLIPATVASPSKKPSRLADSTRQWLIEHGIEPESVSAYMVTAWGEDVDIIRLTANQLARVSETDQPIMWAEDRRDGLVHFKVAPVESETAPTDTPPSASPAVKGGDL